MDLVAHGNRTVVVKRKSTEPMIKFEEDDAEQYSVGIVNTHGEEIMDVKEEEQNERKVRAPRKKKLKVDVEKTPLMVFNESFPEYNAAFQVEKEEGPSHDRLFQLSLVMGDGVRYDGQGRSKKAAKQLIAENVLRSAGKWPVVAEGNSDAAMESVDGADTPFAAGGKTKKRNSESIVKDVVDGKNAVMVINEYHPEAIFTIVNESGKPHDKKFTCSLDVNGKSFVGSGSSKKDANTSAAAKALLEVYGAQCAVNNIDVSDEDQKFVLPQMLADMIGDAVLKKYGELSAACEEVDMKRKVLAGVVKVVHNNDEVVEIEVVSLGTGTKCISGGNISDSGAALNDCHGEVIARRGFCHFLYNQIDLYLKGKGKLTCLQKRRTGLFAVKEGVTFHLYVSTSPCGDARIFSPQETCTIEASDKHPQRKTRGLLRTKIENGEGTLPIKPKGVVQTWDGVLQGERLLTMSCSDKISKWNVVGIQGALLSHFVEPIYLTSVVLGSLYNFHHLTRALYKRLEGLTDLPQLYKLNAHFVNGVSSPEQRATGKSPGYSFNWVSGEVEMSLECVNAAQGKMEASQASRLCKLAHYHKFLALWKKLKRNASDPGSYAEAKHTAGNYQLAMAALKTAYQTKGLGIWVAKPDEHDDF